MSEQQDETKRLQAELDRRKSLNTGLMTEIQHKDGEVKRLIAEKAKLQEELDELKKRYSRSCVAGELMQRRERVSHLFVDHALHTLSDARDLLRKFEVSDDAEVYQMVLRIEKILVPMASIHVFDFATQLNERGKNDPKFAEVLRDLFGEDTIFTQ